MQALFIILDYTSNNFKQPQSTDTTDITHRKKYKKPNDNFDSKLNVSSSIRVQNKISIHHNTRSISIDINRQESSSSNRLFNQKNFTNTHKNRLFEIIPEEKSTDLVMKWINTYKPNHWTSKPKNVLNHKESFNKQLNVFRTSSVKYRAVRVGCWRPIFMFINRGSNEDQTILKDLMDSGISYLILGRNGEVYHEIKNNQNHILDNYSLI